MLLARIVGCTDQLPSFAGVAVSVWGDPVGGVTVTVTVPDVPTFVVPLIVGVESLMSAVAPPPIVIVGGAL